MLNEQYYIEKFKNGEGFKEETDSDIVYFEQENGYPVRVMLIHGGDYMVEEVPFIGY